MKALQCILTTTIVVVLSLFMAVGLKAAIGNEYEIQVSNIKYHINHIDRTAEVVSCAPWLRELNIPSVIVYEDNEYDVKSIRRKAFIDNDSVRIVSIDRGILSIGDSAFVNCKSLRTAILADGITDFGESTFRNCRRLQSFVLGDGGTKIPDYLLAGCDSLVSLTIPCTIKNIGNGAFEGCRQLAEFIAPMALDRIEDKAFKDCVSLSKISVPENLVTIGNNAFENCVSLSEFSVPENLVTIGNNAFENCVSLSEFIFSKNLQTIGAYAFSSSGLKDVNLAEIECHLSNGLGNGAFARCKELKSVILPDNIIVIPNALFVGCVSLSDIMLPQSLTRIGGSAFAHTGIKSILIPPGIKEVGDYSFAGVSEVYGCEGLETIGNYAFSGNISVFPWPKTLRTIGEGGFSHNQFTIVELPEGIESIGNAAFSPASRKMLAGYWELFSTGSGNLDENHRNNTIETVIIPSSLRQMGNFAFSGCYNLVNVVIRDATIRLNDFNDCPKLENIDLGNNIIRLGGLNHCPRLTELTVPSTIIYDGFEDTNIQVLRFKSNACMERLGNRFSEKFERLKYLYIDGDVDLTVLSRLDYVKTLVLGNNIKEFDANCLPDVGGGMSLISVILGKNLELYMKDREYTKYLVCHPIIPPKGGVRIYTSSKHCWVPAESKHLYKEVFKKPTGYGKDSISADLVLANILTIPQSIETSAGKTFDIPIEFCPEGTSIKQAVWISYNQDVVSSDKDGKLVAMKPGIAEVYCLSADGAEVRSNICTVTVTNNQPQHDSIIIQPRSVNIEKGESVQLSVVYENNSDETPKVKWSSSDETIAIVNQSGFLFARKEGSSVISATLMENEDVTDSIKIIVGDNSGIEESIIDFTQLVKVFNMSGTQVFSGKYSDAHLAPGYYIVVCDGKPVKVNVR